MAQWQVIQKGFSAISIGIGFQNHQVGWTTHTDGSSLPKLVKTHDGGKVWNDVQNVTGKALMPLSVAARQGGNTNVAITGPLESTLWSLDGERFVQSVGAPFVSQDVKNEGGKMMIAGANEVCFGALGGATYSCSKKVPLKYKGTGRYASRPNGGKVIYFAAGRWSDSAERVVQVGEEQHIKLSKNLRIIDGKKMAFVADAPTGIDDPSDYSAELWKSTDGGETWTNIFTDEGNFYFNDIHCADETHCVVIAEGFGDTGGEPGVHVLLTADGETFNKVHSVANTGKESLMTARMLTPTEYWAAGTTAGGSLLAPAMILHSTDGGATHTDEGSAIRGQMITSMDCISAGHCYATALTATQICNLLEYGAAPSPVTV